MQKHKVLYGATTDGKAINKDTLSDGTIYRAEVWNDNLFNLFEFLENSGYTLIENDTTQIAKALKTLYNPSYTYNTSSISTQSVDDIVLGSDGFYYKAKINGIVADDPVGSTTGAWEKLPTYIGSGGYSANLYLTNTPSITVPSYYKISYEPLSSDLSLIGTVSSGEVLVEDYIFDADVDTTTIPGGEWSLHFHRHVSASGGETQLRFEFFKRSVGGSETVLFSANSLSIEDTIPTQESINITQPIFNLSATDRLGIKIYASTNRNASTTVTIQIGGTQSLFFTTPLPIRHSQLRARDESNSHPIGAITGLQDALDGKQATIENGGLSINKLDIDGATDIGAGLADTDLIIVNNKKSTLSRFWKFIRDLFSRNFGTVSVKDFGAVGDGITNDYQAFRDAIDSNKNVFIPIGDYYLASTLVVDRAVIIRGAGIGRTRLLKHSTNANHTCLDIKSSNTLFEDFEISIQSGSNVLTVGYGIRLFCDSVAYQSNRANRIKIQHQNYGIGIIETMISSSPLNIIRPTKTYFDNIEVLDSNYIAIEVDGGNDTYFSNVLIDTSRGYLGAEAERGFGVLIKRTEGLWLDKIEALDSKIGILLSPSAGSYIKYVFVSDSAFDTNSDFGLAIDCYAGGELHSVNFNNCWFASNGAQPTEDGFGRGIKIDAGSGSVDNLTQINFNQCRVFNNGQHGAELNNCRNISFNNCEFAGNGNKEVGSYDGLFVGVDVDNLRINGGYYGATAGFTATQRYGINHSSGTSSGAIITGVFAGGNLTGGINDLSASPKVVNNNL